MPNWSEVLQEISNLDAQIKSQAAVDLVRRKHLNNLFEKTGRNVIAYYSGWLSKPGIEGIQINDEDKNGFMMSVHDLERSKGLDLILHTPGGEFSATESIIDYLHQMFDDDIRVIVPQIAMSGGTLIACASREILMGSHSNLGPIDPQVMGVPAYGVIEEFRTAAREIREEPSRVHVWNPILSKYHPTFLSQCENAIEYSSRVARSYLEKSMLKDVPDRTEVARNIVESLTYHTDNKLHTRHIHVEECEELGLKITRLESDQQLQGLVLTVHHAFIHTLMNTPSFKIIENHLGRALIKQQFLTPPV